MESKALSGTNFINDTANIQLNSTHVASGTKGFNKTNEKHVLKRIFRKYKFFVIVGVSETSRTENILGVILYSISIVVAVVLMIGILGLYSGFAGLDIAGILLLLVLAGAIVGLTFGIIKCARKLKHSERENKPDKRKRRRPSKRIEI